MKKTIYSRSSLPKLANYEQVNIFWESVKPIKGWAWSQNVKPLGVRKNTNIFSIKKNEDESISCFLRTSERIRFHVNKTIELWRGVDYPTNSKSFIENILPNCKITIRKFRIFYTCFDGVFEIPLSGQGLILKYNEEKKYYLPINALSISIYKLNREKFKKIKKIYKDYIDFISLSHHERNGEYLEEEYERVFGVVVRRLKWSRMADELEDEYIEHKVCREYIRTDIGISKLNDDEKIESFFMLLESKNPIEKNKALLLLATEGRRYDSINWNETSQKQSLERILKKFEECILARHKLELLDKIDLPYGQFEENEFSNFFKTK